MRLLSSSSRRGVYAGTMATPAPEDRGFCVLRRQGAQPIFDIAAFADQLARSQSDEVPLRILLDWSLIESWPFEVPSPAAIRSWGIIGPSIKRAAIVHARKWNRHAALLSALLRLGGVEVRSFPQRDHSNAADWLKQDGGD
jgi:SpoIIAA-like